MSFTDLNTYSGNVINYTDNRDPDVLFNIPGPAADLSFDILSKSFTLQRSVDIVEIIQPTVTAITFEVDVSAISGVTVTWSSLPAGCSVVEVNDVYILSGIDSVSDWETVRAPTITVPTTFDGSFTYTCSIKYTTNSGRINQTWDVGNYIPVSLMPAEATLDDATPSVIRGFTESYVVSTTISAELSETAVSRAPDTEWLAEQTNDIDAPDLVWTGASDTWYFTITPSNINIVSDIDVDVTVSGLTKNFNNTTKIFTMNGNEAQINTALDNLVFTATTTREDFTFGYSVYRAGDTGTIYSRIQNANCLNIRYLGPARGTPTYTTQTFSTIGTSLFQITDPDYTGSDDYTYKVYPQNTNLVADFTSGGPIDWGTESTFEYTIGNATGTALVDKGAFGIDETTVVWSDYFDNSVSGGNDGVVHWLIKDTDERTWSIVKSVYGGAGDQFGISVAQADDGTTIIGANKEGTSAGGAVYVYEKGSGNTWTFAQKITSPNVNSATDEDFGYRVKCSSSGDTLAIGAPNFNNGDGAIYIYTRTGTGNYTHSTTFTGELQLGNYIDISADGTQIFGTYANSFNQLASSSIWRYTTSWSEYDTTSLIGVKDALVLGSDHVLYRKASDTVAASEWNGSTAYAEVATKGLGSFTMSANPDAQKNQNEDRIAIEGRTSSGTPVGTDPSVMLIDFDTSTDTFGDTQYADLTGVLSSKSTFHGFCLSPDGTELQMSGVSNVTGTVGDPVIISYTYDQREFTFNSVDKSYTMTGTRSNLNTYIDTIKIKSANGVVSDILLNVRVDTPDANTETKQITVANAG